MKGRPCEPNCNADAGGWIAACLSATGLGSRAECRATKAIAEIEKLGGMVGVDGRSVADKPVIWVYLAKTKVTDAGLEHLKGLKQLRALYLWDTHITDAGLKHLKGFKQLQALYLNSTQVTDAGLEHLKGLKQLTILDLGHTQVTDAGVKDLQKALSPEARIVH